LDALVIGQDANSWMQLCTPAVSLKVLSNVDFTMNLNGMDEMLERTAIEFTNLYRIVYVPCHLIPGFSVGTEMGVQFRGRL
jgi:hypothetical protein